MKDQEKPRKTCKQCQQSFDMQVVQEGICPACQLQARHREIYRHVGTLDPAIAAFLAQQRDAMGRT